MGKSKLSFLTIFLSISSLILGEGTKQLRPTITDDGYLNLMDTQNGLGTERTFALYDATDDTRLNIRIGDPQTELIYLGFRTFNTNTLYYRIKAPDGTIVVPETLVPMTDGDAGRIIDYDEAVAGPNVIDAANGYLPIVFDPSATNQTGDYSIEFSDPTHDITSGSYARRKFELFDITVVESNTNTAIAGRLWSRAWDITTNARNNEFSGSTYIYTNDGITTKAEFDGFVPWSFIIQSNSTGPANTGIVEDDRQSINGGILLPDYRIFLTEPDSNEFPISDLPAISGLPNLDACTSSSTYCINIELSNPGIIEYVIDVAGAAGFDDVRDVKLLAEVAEGENCLPWNGLDGEGNAIGSSDVFDIILSYQTGITHLFIHDPENNENGFNVEHVSPGSANTPQLFYDDSNVSGSTDLDGCSAMCHIWDSNFGDEKTINTWWVTFLEDDTIKDISIGATLVKSEVDIIVSEPVACDGNQMTLEANNILNTGSNPALTWQVNNVDQGSGNTFIVTNINEGDSIKLILTPSELCLQPDTSIIVVSIPKSPIVSNNTTQCVGDSALITATNISADFRWLVDGNEFSLDTIDSVYVDMTRTYTAEVTYLTPSNDLIINGDFEAGNTGFTSEYRLATGNIGNGQYKIVTNPQEALNVFYDLNDHTSGSGNMIVVDGNTLDGSVVYSTTVNVEIGTVYNFSTWATSVFRRNAPNLQFLINGAPLNSLLLDLLPRWTQFNTHWTADVTGPIEIKIVNRNTAGTGNDFALDDIVFGPVATCTNEVEITATPLLTTTADIKSISALCEGDSLLLEIFDTTNIGSSPDYEWSVNGTVRGTNDDFIVLKGLSNNDSISVITTSSISSCIINKDTSFVRVSILSKPEISISGNPFCEGDTATLTTTLSNHNGTPIYQWTPNDSIIDSDVANAQVFPQSNTEYQVIVTDDNNCKDTATYETVILNKPEIMISGASSACIGDSIELTSAVINQADPVSYSWVPTSGLSSSILSTIKAAPSVDTDYQLFIEDNNGCKDTAVFEISLFSDLTVSIDPQNPICEGDITTLNTTVNTTNPVTYLWTPNLTIADNTAENALVSPKTDTEYKVVATSADGCEDSTTYMVTVLDRPVVTIANVAPICEGDTAILSASSTNTITSYDWTPAEDIIDPALATIQAHPSVTTEYQVIVTDDNNCKDTAKYTLNILDRPVVTIANIAPICEGDTTTLSASSISTITSYTWTPVEDIIDPALATIQVHPSTTTEYVVVVADNNNCKDTATYMLEILDRPIVTISNSASICEGDTTTLTASSTNSITSYDWTPVGDIIDPALATIQVHPSVTTVYQVIVTDNNNCIDTANYSLEVHDRPIVTIANVAPICEGDTTTLSASSTSTITSYDWTPVEDIIDSKLANIEAHPSATTDYQVIVTDNNNCIDTANYTLDILNNPTVSITTTSPICAGDTTILNTSVTNTITSYSWATTNNSIINPTLANIQVHPTLTTAYQVTVTDDNNCKATDVYELTVFSKPNVTINGGNVCNGLDIALVSTTTDFSGSLTYTWSPAISLNADNQSSAIASPTEKTTYTLFIKDGNDCLDTTTTIVDLLSSSNPTLNFTVDSTICPTDELIIEGETLSGGTYQWYNNGNAITGETDSILTITEPGNYSLSDDNGCPKQYTDTIEILFDEFATVNAGESIVVDETDFTILNGETNGTAVWSISSSESGINIIEDNSSLTSLINTSVGNNGTYILELCSSSPLGKCPQACDSITVLIRGTLYAPNLFTPSGDGVNETFAIQGIKDFPEAIVSIHNRWGNKVYETDNYAENEWDGEDSPIGVYFYIIDLGGDDKDDNFSGVIHILR